MTIDRHQRRIQISQWNQVYRSDRTPISTDNVGEKTIVFKRTRRRGMVEVCIMSSLQISKIAAKMAAEGCAIIQHSHTRARTTYTLYNSHHASAITHESRALGGPKDIMQNESEISRITELLNTPPARFLQPRRSGERHTFNSQKLKLKKT